MRLLLILLPALAMAQTPPPPLPQPRHPRKLPPPPRNLLRQPPLRRPQPIPRRPNPPAPATRSPGRGAAGRGAATAAKPAIVAAPAPLTTDEQKTVYALGLMMGQSIAMFNLTPAELELVKRALTDAAAGKPAVELAEWGPKIQPLATSRSAARGGEEKRRRPQPIWPNVPPNLGP